MSEHIDGAAYDLGYASVDRARAWGPAAIRLHLGWLSSQLRINPDDEFRWGRYDALCDLLATFEPVLAGGPDDPLSALTGRWSRRAA